MQHFCWVCSKRGYRGTQQWAIRQMVPWDTLSCAVVWGCVSGKERGWNDELHSRRQTLKNKYSLKILILNWLHSKKTELNCFWVHMQTSMAIRMHYKVKLWPLATVLYVPLFLTCIQRLEDFFTYKKKKPKNLRRVRKNQLSNSYSTGGKNWSNKYLVKPVINHTLASKAEPSAREKGKPPY